jgi:hypothetical protein
MIMSRTSRPDRQTELHRRPIATDNTRYTGQSCSLSFAGRQKAVLFFRSKLICREGEGPASRPNLARDVQRRAFTPAVILFIALLEAKDNIDPG